ncbi:alpha/beta hydrolase [Streptomyces palmae]|uniref:Alpha/beta hydrolase n=1 Tax=Streptomyces palmae TaxID=1701085 RepID=A0A4Z0GIS4_9ACTN|nr:alpha/beta hydrolase [Streptomyces palmae]
MGADPGPVRAELTIDGRRLSYLDFGGTGRPLLALHGHLSEGASFTHLAGALGPEWRVIAPDQRGHGDSDRAAEYTRQGYLADLVALIEHLSLTEPPVVLGHSLGGINAYHLAAERPDLVSALVNVDAPVYLPGGPSPLAFVANMPYTAATREELLDAVGPMRPMVEQTLRPLPEGGWRLPFHPRDTVDSETLVHGEHWAQWVGSDCPALLVNGSRSQAVPGEQADMMVARRSHTRLVTLNTDHFVGLRDPDGLAKAVGEFLAGL